MPRPCRSRRATPGVSRAARFFSGMASTVVGGGAWHGVPRVGGRWAGRLGDSSAWCDRSAARSGVTLACVSLMRRCSRTACPRPAVATLTYVYADSTAVLGPLATFAEPHTYDLCGQHAERLTAPRGWEVVRLLSRFDDLPVVEDDLLAVAEALREQGVRERSARQAPPMSAAGGGGSVPDDYSGRHRNGSGGEGHVGSHGGSHGGGAGGPRAEWSPDRRGRLRVLRQPQPRSADL